MRRLLEIKKELVELKREIIGLSKVGEFDCNIFTGYKSKDSIKMDELWDKQYLLCRELKELCENDTILYMYFLKAIEQELIILISNEEKEENEPILNALEDVENKEESALNEATNYEPLERITNDETIKYAEAGLDDNKEVEVIEINGKVEVDRTDYYRAYRNVKPEDNPLLKMSKIELLSPYGAKLLARYGHLLKAS